MSTFTFEIPRREGSCLPPIRVQIGDAYRDRSPQEQLRAAVEAHVATQSPRADLREADLSEGSLANIDFRGADLCYAEVCRADLRRTVLRWADMRWADMRGADMRWADMRWGDLRGGDLRRTVLRRADMRWGDMRGGDMREADMRRADLRGGDLRRTVLRGADLRWGDLREADLREADMREVNLQGTDVTKVNFVGARLTGAHLPDGVPFVPDIDAAIYRAVTSGGGKLDMSDWHPCGTTHCRAGWAIHLAGEAGYALEKRFGPLTAGALIYARSRPEMPVPDFFAQDEDALADLRRGGAQPAGNSS